MIFNTEEEELLAELKRQQLLFSQLAELYHWASKFWLTAAIWFLIATGAILLTNNIRLWALCGLAGVLFAAIGQFIGWRARRIERKEGLR